jgi:hypothetical protein
MERDYRWIGSNTTFATGNRFPTSRRPKRVDAFAWLALAPRGFSGYERPQL